MILRPAVALLAALAVPASAAAAPVLAPLKPCYVSYKVDPATGDAITEDVPLSGSGFTPSALVNVSVDGFTAATNVPVDANGNLPAGITVSAPLQEKGQRPFTITVTEQQNAAQTVSATTLVSALLVTARPSVTSPTHRVTWIGRGFTVAAPVWAHYVRGRHVRRTVRFAAAPSGPCGTFKIRRRQFPFRPRVGHWLLQVDQDRKYSRTPTTAFALLDIFVRRVVKLGH